MEKSLIEKTEFPSLKQLTAKKIIGQITDNLLRETALPLLTKDVLDLLSEQLIAKDPYLFLDVFGSLLHSQVFEEQDGLITSIVLRNDGKYIVTISDRGALRVLHVKTGTRIRLNKDSDITTSALFDRFDRIISGHGNDEARIWDLSQLPKVDPIILNHAPYTTQMPRIYQLPPRKVCILHVSSDGKYLATAYDIDDNKACGIEEERRDTGLFTWPLESNADTQKEANQPIWHFDSGGVILHTYIAVDKVICARQEDWVQYNFKKRDDMLGNNKIELSITHPILSKNGRYLLAKAWDAQNFILFDLSDKQPARRELLRSFAERFGFYDKRCFRGLHRSWCEYDKKRKVNAIPLIKMLFSERKQRKVVSYAVTDEGIPQIQEGFYSIPKLFRTNVTITNHASKTVSETPLCIATGSLSKQFTHFDPAKVSVAAQGTVAAYRDGNKLHVFDLAQLCKQFSFLDLLQIYKQAHGQKAAFKSQDLGQLSNDARDEKPL